MTDTLNIEGKKLPPDFYDYFNADGSEKNCPYTWDDYDKFRQWCDRKVVIKFMFMIKEQADAYKEFVIHSKNKMSSPYSKYTETDFNNELARLGIKYEW